MHARMEEAVEHALAIINGASKFAEEAQLEQVTVNYQSGVHFIKVKCQIWHLKFQNLGI